MGIDTGGNEDRETGNERNERKTTRPPGLSRFHIIYGVNADLINAICKKLRSLFECSLDCTVESTSPFVALQICSLMFLHRMQIRDYDKEP